MIDIVPAVLPHSWSGLEAGLEKIKGISKFVQIDLVGENVLVDHEEMPHWQEFDFEFDIMLKDPAKELQSCVDMGASRIIVHADAESAHAALEALQQYRVGDYPILISVALAAHDTPEKLAQFDGLYDFVQVMGIDHIGKQGEPADPHHKDVELVMKLREAYPFLQIQVDGAVASRVEMLAKAGANRLIIGGAIMEAQNPGAIYKELYTKVNA